MKKTIIFSILFLALLSSKDPNQNRLAKVTTNDDYNYIAINNILMWVANNGDGSHDPVSDGNGFYWPGGEKAVKSAIFEDGLLWGGIINTVLPDTQNIRVNGNTHRQGLQAGKIFETGEADDPHNPKYRVYKIRKDWQELPFGSKKDTYQKDYEQWPVEDGAPWIDKDHDGIYTPYIDEPDFLGDEVLWYVANDLDTSRSTFTYGSLPLGIEQQVTVWGFNRAKELGNIVFKKYKIINKGQFDIDSMYFSYFSDPDLGNAGDDFIGCDTLLNMTYCWNDDDNDSGYDAPVPAVGNVLLQGPVYETSIQDSAFFDGRWLFGSKNRHMTASWLAPNASFIQLPRQADYRGTLEFYNIMRGMLHNGQYFTNPITGENVIYFAPGDPVTGTGWYEGEGWPGGPSSDNRFFIQSTGPFKLNIGETQEYVTAFVIGRGVDHIDSISKIRRLAKVAQNAYFNNFQPLPMPQPISRFHEQDKKVTLHWQDNAENFIQPDPYIDTFESADTTYNFEGYRIWQYRDKHGSDPRPIAVFDLKNNIDEIYDYRIISGTHNLVNVFDSPDEGVRRSITISMDTYSNQPLNNGSSYYFGVTAYAYNPESDPTVLESEHNVMEIMPKANDIDLSYGQQFEDLNIADQISGDGHGQIISQIINPDLLTGDSYKVIIHGTEPDTLAWSLINQSTKDTIISKIRDFGLDTAQVRNFDGFKLLVQNQGRDSLDDIAGKVFGVKSVMEVANPSGELETPLDLINGKNSDGTFSVTAYGPDIIDIKQNINSQKSDAIGYDNYEIRFTEEGSEYYLYGYFAAFRGPITRDSKAKNRVPFEIWNIGRDHDSTDDDVRLKIKIQDSEPGHVDSTKYFPDSVWTRTPKGTWEPIFAWIEPDSTYHDNLPDKLKTQKPEWFPLHNIVIDGELPQRGTVIRIIPWRPLQQGDEFVFETIAPDTADLAKAKQNVDKITVFPNPYFGSIYRAGQPGQGFMRFGKLPDKVLLRIYNIAGILITRLEKDNASPWLDWNLRNQDGKTVGSGVYIAHLQMPGIGKKIIKLALVQDN